jgi:DNA invertase Pin-like site-specific DNA recombinase
MGRKKRLQPAFAYGRQSNAVEGSDSQRRQFEATKAAAERMGFEIIDEFWDFGISGTKGASDRPELSRMYAAIEEQGVKTIFCESISRLARDTFCGLVLISQLTKDYECKVYDASCTDLYSSNENGRFITQVLFCVAELEKCQLVARMAKGRAAKRTRTGKKVEGRKAFGATAEEYVILKYIEHLRRKPRQTDKKIKTKRLTYQQVCDQLNEQGFKTQLGREWTVPNVARIATQELEASNEFNHSQKDVDEAFMSMMPISRKQIDLLRADPVPEIKADDVALVLGTFWQAEGVIAPWGFESNQEGYPVLLDGEPVAAAPPTEEEQERGRNLWNKIGLEPFAVPSAPRNIVHPDAPKMLKAMKEAWWEASEETSNMPAGAKLRQARRRHSTPKKKKIR